MKIHTSLHSNIRKDGTQLVRITVNLDKTVHFSTGVRVPASKWDEARSCIRGKSKEANDGNMIIEKTRVQLDEIIFKYRMMDKPISAAMLKQEFINPTHRIDFHKFLKAAIGERIEIASTTKQQHYVLANKLRLFQNELAFSEIDYDFLMKFQRYLATHHKNSTNTIYNMMKTFKTYMAIAEKKGVIQDNPFNQVVLRQVRTDRTSLSKEELRLLYAFRKDKHLTDTERRITRHFLFMCYTGLRISDLKRITHDQIILDTLIYVPHKTRSVKAEQIQLPLPNQALILIQEEKTTIGPVFNLFSEQKMNYHIKEVCKKLEIPKVTTNHTGRHTFASLFIEMTHDVATLQYFLGHSKISTTMQYVHLSMDDARNQMNSFAQKIKDHE